MISGKRVNKSARRACNTMVTNPIYDGPVYESVPQPRFDALTSAVLNHSHDPSRSHLLTNSDTHRDQLTARYVKHPSQSQSQSDSIYLSDQYSTISHDVANSGTSSMPASERNNLPLTIPTIITSSNSVMDEVNTTPKPLPDSPSLMPAMLSDTYTVMSPAGTITASNKDKE